MTTSTDRIEKRVLLRASRERVWEAITDAKKFGTWFGVEFETAFAAGQRVHGRIVPTKMDAEVAKEQEPYTGMEFDVLVDEVSPMDRFSFRWHPGEPPIDETDPMTLVTFELREAKDGTIPAARLGLGYRLSALKNLVNLVGVGVEHRGVVGDEDRKSVV